MASDSKAILKLRFLPFCLLFFFSIQVDGQSPFSSFEHLFTTPRNYVVPYALKGPIVDGKLTDEAWLATPWTEPFLDIEGEKKPTPKYATRAKMLWSDSCLYIAAELEEPHVWASLKQHDAVIYYDNDFEVFIDPNNDTHQYFEIEVNAFNTIFDLFMPKPYRNGGSAMIAYNTPGLQSAVNVTGTINKSTDKDSGWTVEMAIPFKAIYLGNNWRTPQEGALWRINFSRVQWETEVVNKTYVKKKDKNGKPLPEHNWVWSPQGVINMHFPERWGYILFTKETANELVFILPQDEKRKQYLWLLYYKQKAFYGKHKGYAKSLEDLGLNGQVMVDGTSNQLSMEATTRQFSIYITDQNTTLSINDEGFVQVTDKGL